MTNEDANDLERESEKREQQETARRFWGGQIRPQPNGYDRTYTIKHTSFIIKQIKRRLTGEMGDQEFSEWHRMLGNPKETREYIDAWYLEQEIIAKENQTALSSSTPSLAARCDPHRHAK